MLIACVIPAFLGESHFAFLGYALAFRQTPVKRQIDYLRFLGASKDSAKELKLFGLSKFLTDRFQQLSDDVYIQNVSLAKRRLVASSLLSLLTTIGYYGAYAYVILETVEGKMSVGTLTFLTGAIAGASANLQMIFSTFSQHCRPVAFPDRPAAIFCCPSHGFLQAQRIEDSAAHHNRNRISRCQLFLSRRRPHHSSKT